MTLTPSRDALESRDIPRLTSDEDFSADAALREYAATDLFRSAKFSELVLEDNPYRRPVRPDDLEWLRFDPPLTAERSCELTALLGHRMLLNIYDTERCLVARDMTAERWAQFDTFYGADNRSRGERVRPFLERHLFGFVNAYAADQVTAAPLTRCGAAGLALDLAGDSAIRADAVATLCAGAAFPDRLGITVAIQAIGLALAAPAGPATAAFAAGAISVGAPSEIGVGGLGTLIAGVAEDWALPQDSHALYQFYLPTTMARANYLTYLARDPARRLRWLGAMAVQAVEFEAAVTATDVFGLTGHYRRAALADHDARPPAVRWITDTVVPALEHRFGPRGLHEFAEGMTAYARLCELDHDDVMTQLRWIDAEPRNVERAERLQAAITEHNIPVRLDTFVESFEECSTTHVHDDHRLVVIESGEMEFWNYFGGVKKLTAGQKMFVPMHRLHGSVVKTGICVYHQPVISDELLAEFG